MTDKNITITGGDPSNPRCMAHIVQRLEQIKRDTAAMEHEVRRLNVFADHGRDILLDRGYSLHFADATVAEIRKELAQLTNLLDEASTVAARAGDATAATGIPLHQRFERRPDRTEVR